MLTAVSCIILILSFITLPFFFSLKLNADVLENKGEIKLSVFFIPVFKADLSFRRDGVLQNNIVLKSGKREEEIHLNADKNDKQSIMALMRTLPVMSYIIFERMSLGARIGFGNDAYYTTMFTGAVRALFYAFASFLKSRQNITVYEEIVPSYNAGKLDFDFFGILKLSIANIINSFFAGLANKIKNRYRNKGAV